MNSWDENRGIPDGGILQSALWDERVGECGGGGASPPPLQQRAVWDTQGLPNSKVLGLEK